MDTVDESLGLLGRHSVHLSTSGDKFGHAAVGEEHELLYEPVGLLGDFLVDVDGLALLVHLDLHLGALEIHRAGLEAAFAERQRELVEHDERFLHGLRGLAGLDDGLSLVIIEAMI